MVQIFDRQISRPRGFPRAPWSAVSQLLDRHRERPFDVAVYQMGNGRAHDFLYGVLSRLPGLLVLHDLVLHHSRAAQFLESEAVRAWRRDPSSAAAREAARPSLDAWRSELEYCYPVRGERLHEVHLGTVGDLLPYAYPLFRIPVEASKAVAVHNAFMADAIRAESARQNDTLELIASENHVSKAVLTATGSVFTNKYAEGLARLKSRIKVWQERSHRMDQARFAD